MEHLLLNGLQTLKFYKKLEKEKQLLILGFILIYTYKNFKFSIKEKCELYTVGRTLLYIVYQYIMQKSFEEKRERFYKDIEKENI